MIVDDLSLAEELRDRELKLDLISLTVHEFHRVPTYSFRIGHAETDVELGGIRLRIGSTPHVSLYAGHIGYDVHTAHRGHHYAARSVRLLLPLVSRHGLDLIWITCDPENVASRHTIELAGGEFVEIIDVSPDCGIFKSGHPRKCRYRLASTLEPKPGMTRI